MKNELSFILFKEKQTRLKIIFSEVFRKNDEDETKEKYGRKKIKCCLKATFIELFFLK